MYFQESVADNKHKPKKLWGLLKDLGSSNKCKTKITNIGLKIKETICFDKLLVATHFNNFFCNIAENLVNFHQLGVNLILTLYVTFIRISVKTLRS